MTSPWAWQMSPLSRGRVSMLLGSPHGPTHFPGTSGVSYRVNWTLTGVSGDSVGPHGYGRVPQDGPTADAGLGCLCADPLAANRRFPQLPWIQLTCWSGSGNQPAHWVTALLRRTLAGTEESRTRRSAGEALHAEGATRRVLPCLSTCFSAYKSLSTTHCGENSSSAVKTRAASPPG